MGNYEGWSLDRLWSEYNHYKQEQGRAAGKEERLRRAYNRTKDPFGVAKETRGTLEKMQNGDLPAGRWKGNSRDTFNSSLEDVDWDLKKAINTDLDDYRDAIETARMNAQRKSGLYVPILSDVYSAIKKLGN